MQCCLIFTLKYQAIRAVTSCYSCAFQLIELFRKVQVGRAIPVVVGNCLVNAGLAIHLA